MNSDVRMKICRRNCGGTRTVARADGDGRRLFWFFFSQFFFCFVCFTSATSPARPLRRRCRGRRRLYRRAAARRTVSRGAGKSARRSLPPPSAQTPRPGRRRRLVDREERYQLRADSVKTRYHAVLRQTVTRPTAYSRDRTKACGRYRIDLYPIRQPWDSGRGGTPARSLLVPWTQNVHN